MNKKVSVLLILIIFCVAAKTAFAVGIPHQFAQQKTSIEFSDSSLYLLTHLSIKEIQLLSGRKLTFKEKIALKIYKSNPGFFNRFTDSTDQKKLENKARWAKRLGIGSLISLFIPFVDILALPAAIIAIVFGKATQNKVKNKRDSKQGITFGIITIGAILLMVTLIIIILSSFGFA
ncbi:MAG: hypothetical protein ABIP30_10270 [Ferruginibacter sp.]